MAESKADARAFLKSRQAAYRATFSLDLPPSVAVLKDLAVFCRATQSTFHPDAQVSAYQQGRRDVFLRVSEHMNLNDAELWALVGGE